MKHPTIITPGDTLEPQEYGQLWTAGIHFTDHGNAIECHGNTKEEAESRRDYILDAIACYECCFEEYVLQKKITTDTKI